MQHPKNLLLSLSLVLPLEVDELRQLPEQNRSGDDMLDDKIVSKTGEAAAAWRKVCCETAKLVTNELEISTRAFSKMDLRVGNGRRPFRDFFKATLRILQYIIVKFVKGG